MGLPAESYRYGIMQSMHVLCFIALMPVVGYLYGPIFHRLQVTSSFEVGYVFIQLFVHYLIIIISIVKSTWN